MRRGAPCSSTVEEVREGAGLVVAPLERRLSVLNHEEVREGVVPHSARVGAAVQSA